MRSAIASSVCAVLLLSACGQSADKTAGAAKAAPAAPDFHVKDLSLADWGRKETSVAEHEMPGLMAVRKKLATETPGTDTGYWKARNSPSLLRSSAGSSKMLRPL